MFGVNRVTLIGNVGKDPETHYLENGVAVTTFPLATSETHRNKNGERITITEWHNIVLWKDLAEIAEKHVKKGKPLYIEGKIRTRSWDDKNGNRRLITEIVGTNMIMLGPRDKDATPNSQQTTEKDNGTVPTNIEDMEDIAHLPF